MTDRKTNSLQTENFITIGVFSLIYFAVAFIIGGIAQMTPITFPFMPMIVAIFTGSVFMLYDIGGFCWYLSLYAKPKTAFYTLGFIYFVEALIFSVIILEQKSVRKIYKNKQRSILAALLYAMLIISLFIIFIKYMPEF